ncbi:MAG: peptidylprolyl isomerase [Gemmatimonadota bacterium]
MTAPQLPHFPRAAALALATVALLPPARAATQEPDLPAPTQPQAAPQLLDGIAAVVGDSIVLRSYLDEQLVDLARAGQQLPNDPVALAELRGEILRGLVEELVIVQAALQDSVIVPEEEIQGRVDQEIEQVEARYANEGGAPAMQAALQREGLTLAAYRNILAGRLRKRETITAYMREMRQSRGYPPVTDQDVRDLYEEQKERLGQRPATVSFRQVVIAPEPSEEAKEAALEEMRGILDELAEGAEFEALARRHSDDPGSRQLGGDLGWFRRGIMVDEFDRVVFTMRVGQISPIVETPFGFHVIKLEKTKGPERQASHILVTPEITDADRERARARADSVAAALRDGASIEDMIEEYHDEGTGEQSRVGPFPRDLLQQRQPAYAAALETGQVGDVAGPLELPGPPDVKFAVVLLTEVAAAGEFSFDEAEATLRQQLQDQRLYQEVVGELSSRMYVDVRL